MSDSFREIPFYIPDVGDEEIGQLTDAIRSTWVTSGPKVGGFERAFCRLTGAPAALALHSCTAGLHLSLAAHGIGKGDEVILPAMTFCSTANVVVHCGATPVIVDVEPDYLTIDPHRVQAAITERTKAVIAVHYAGSPADLGALRSLCKERNVLLIEDAAHAFPATHKGETIGSAGNPTAFSFYSTKNITTGEGGMLCGSQDFIDKCRRLATHGLSSGAWKRYQAGGSWLYDMETPGFKYNMTELQAAMGLAQLSRLDSMQQRRREIARFYTTALERVPGITPLASRPDCDTSWHLYIIRVAAKEAGLKRDELMQELKDRGIHCSVHFIPLYLLSFYREHFNLQEESYPESQAAFEEIISLPLYPALTDEDVEHITASINGIVR